MSNIEEGNILMSTIEEGVIEISADRLRKLEELESNVPTLVAAALEEYKKNKLRLLHEKDKQDPTAMNRRVKRYTDKHRDQINAKRREKRRLEKLRAIEEEQKEKEGNPTNITIVPMTILRRARRVMTATNTVLQANGIEAIKENTITDTLLGDAPKDAVIQMNYPYIARPDGVTLRFDS